MNISDKSNYIIKNVDLLDFVCYLSSTNPMEINSLEDFAERVKHYLTTAAKEPSDFSENTRILVRNLIHNQFPNPLLDGMREVISNALDAHTRAKQEIEPIKITVSQGKFILKDRGDGMGKRNLFDLFVPAISVNAKPDQTPQHASSAVSGRFGQGFLASLHSLNPEDYEMRFWGESRTYHLSWRIPGKKIVIKAFVAEEEVVVESSIEPLAEKRKMSIHTYREGDTPLKIQLITKDGALFFNLIQKPKEHPGTILKIASPEILQNEQSILSYIQKIFLSFTKSIVLNGKPIYTPSSEPNCENFPSMPNYLFLKFDGGTLYYAPLQQMTPARGVLKIFEKGRLVTELPLGNAIIPKETILDFNHLSLTQVRKEVDFTSSEISAYATSLLDTLLMDSSLTGKVKGALLNAMTPILEKGQVQLKQHLLQLFKEKKCSIYPQELIDCEDEESLYLNSQLFPLSAQTPFASTRTYALYCISAPRGQPITAVDKDGMCHIFIDRSLYCPENPNVWKLNLHLLKQWLEKREPPLSITPSDLFMDPPEKNVKVEITLPSSHSSLEEYDNYPPGYVHPSKDYNGKNYLIEYMPKYLCLTDPHWERACRIWIFCKLKSYASDQQEKENLYKSIPLEEITEEEEIDYVEWATKQPWFPHIEKILKRSWIRPQYLRYLCEALVSPKEKDFLPLSVIDKDDPFFDLVLQHQRTRCSVKYLHQYLSMLYSSWENKTTPAKSDLVSYFKDVYIESLINKDEKGFISRFQTMLNNYYNWQRIINLCDCRDSALKKETLGKLGHRDLENLKSGSHCSHEPYLEIATRIASSLAGHAFIYNALTLNHFDFLLALTKEELIAFFSALPTSSISLEDMKEEDYVNIYHLTQRKEISPSLVKKWVELYCHAFHHCHNSLLKDTGAIFQLLLSYLNEKNSLSIEELEIIIAKFKKFNEECQFFYWDFYCLEDIYKKENSEEKITSFCRNSYKDWKLHSLEEVIATLKRYLELWNNEKSTREEIADFYRGLWEKEELITAPIRPFVYSMLYIDDVEERVAWSPLSEEACYLHQDPDVVAALGSEEIAKRRIQGAFHQTLEDYFFVREVCKNSKEARATKIGFDIALDETGNPVILITDDGCGMDIEGINALKTPNKTTKIRRGEDPNYGWGFFTVFRNCNEVLVITSKKSCAQQRIRFKRTPEGILRQHEIIEGSYPAGTKILLRMEGRSGALERIKLQAELISCCRYMKGIDVTFRGTSINSGAHPATFLEEAREEMTLHIGRGEEGIYYKEMRIGSLPLESLNLLPKDVQKILTDNRLRLRLFLPQTRQVMNRNHLMDESAFSEKVSRLVYAAALNFTLQQWIESIPSINPFTFLSEDDWRLFDRRTTAPSEKMLTAIDAFRFPSPLQSDDRPAKIKEKMRQASLELFNALDKGSCRETFEKSLGEVLIFKKDEPYSFDELQKHLADPVVFSRTQLHLPLKKGGASFVDIKSRVKEQLIEEQILLPSGTCDYQYLETLTAGEIHEISEKAFEKAQKSLGAECGKILLEMKNNVDKLLQSIKICTVPQKEALEQNWEEETIERFILKLAHLFDSSISVQYYTKNDEATAYVLRGKPIIYVNRLKYPQIFSKLEKGAVENGEFSLELIQFIARVTETVLHELTHLQENSDCEVTHDAHFRKSLASKIASLFYRQEQCPIPLLELFAASMKETVEVSHGI